MTLVIYSILLILHNLSYFHDLFFNPLFLDTASFVNTFLSIMKDTPPSTAFFDIVNSNTGLIAGFITSITLIITTIIKSITYLKNKVTEENRIIREETKKAIEKVEEQTIKRVEDNKKHIENVQNNISEQVTYQTNKLGDKLETQKDTIGEIKNIVEKVDDKLDKNIDIVTKNTIRIGNVEYRIETFEDLVFDRVSSSLSSISRTRVSGSNNTAEREFKDTGKKENMSDNTKYSNQNNMM